MAENPVSIGPYRCGEGQPLLVIAGPCVIEDRDSCLQIASRLSQIAQRRSIQIVFKASFDKANRTSVENFRGPGLEKGLAILKSIKDEMQVPIVTDVHEARATYDNARARAIVARNNLDEPYWASKTARKHLAEPQNCPKTSG